MNLKNLTEVQKEALMDLAALAMYADGHLADAEDERVQALVARLGYETEYERNRQYDAAVSRVGRQASTVESARDYAASRAHAFSGPEERQTVADILVEIVGSDRRFTESENRFLTIVRETLR